MSEREPSERTRRAPGALRRVVLAASAAALALVVGGAGSAYAGADRTVHRIGRGPVVVAQLWEHEYFQGDSVELRGAPCDQLYNQYWYRLPRADFNDRTSSYKIYYKCTFRFYEDFDLQHASLIEAGTQAARMLPGWNDRISSAMAHVR
ncbi:hypothetical protein ABT354_12495 [Streptomyces sp. NPDC000594]|uniref:hypothetical protein n=1 Tax=Streptomyces sp. NPDC000594 TaxID=3154261 RepID=UPI00331A39A7